MARKLYAATILVHQIQIAEHEAMAEASNKLLEATEQRDSNTTKDGIKFYIKQH